MDFLNPKKKRAHIRRLYIGYGLIAILLSISTLALVIVANGYGVNRRGAITQNGIVYVDTSPVSADIYIDGTKRGTADARFVLEEGDYTISLSREGYRTWQKDFTLEGSSIERLIYPFLFPQDLKATEIQKYDTTPDIVSASPDRQWIVEHRASDMNNFTVINTSTEENTTTTITVPSSILPTRPNQKLEAVEWSYDNRHLLFRAVFDGGSEYYMLDREKPNESLNLTQVFGHNFSKVVLHDKRYDLLYVYSSSTGLVEAADLRTGQLNPIASRILAFFPYGSSKMIYVTKDDAPTGMVNVTLLDGDQTYALRSLPESPAYFLNMASYDGNEYVIVGANTDKKAYLYQDPFGSIKRSPLKAAAVKALLKVDSTITSVEFSANTQFIAVQGGSTFAVYDAENNRQYRYDVDLELSDGIKAQWMDGHRLMLASAGQLNAFDFDGTNKQTLTNVTAGFIPMFDRDYKVMYTVSPATNVADKVSLFRTELTVK